MSIKVVDKRKSTNIKVGDLPEKATFTLIGSGELLVIMEANQQYNRYASCFNVNKMIRQDIENHLSAQPCSIEVSILDEGMEDDRKDS